ncbi:LysR family transcriptional regulator [Lederbergia graminis]|uniref:LysR family transcriptional regulator n=1 Tax=Lederbergia graminis TaxID=735518 RepID=A0ABW0LHU6_9BACI
MDLRTIKTFQTIVKCGSFQQAAEQLNYAQSTVTTQIKKLENDLGVTLLERGNHLQLTEAGRLLYEKGELLLRSFDHVKQSMTELVEGEAGILRIGVMEPMASYRLPVLLTMFSKQFPKVQISLQIHGSSVLADMVEKEEIDIAICAAPDIYRDTEFDPIFSEKVALLIPETHRLSKVEHVKLVDLYNEKLLITNSTCPFRGNFERKLLESGIIPSYGMEVSNLMALKYYVQAGFGAAIVPLITIQPPPVGTVMKHIMDFPSGLTVGSLRKVNNQQSKFVHQLLTILKSNS